MERYKLEACSNGKQFIFEFSFDNKLGQKCDEYKSRYVSYRLLRNDKPTDDDIFYWEGCLSTDNVESFELQFPDQINIKGNIQLFINEQYDYIWIDAHYCYRLEEHFEGNILNISKPDVPPFDPIPDPVIDPLPNEDITEQESVMPSGFDDLFPYLFVSKWPNLTKEEQTYFMLFDNDTTDTSSLYNTYLVNFDGETPKDDAREHITTTTFNFINEEAPFDKGQYITNTTTLKAPYNLFPSLYDKIHLSESSDTSEELISYVISKLSLEVTALKTLLKSKEYLALKDRVWQNVFALSVLDFYNSKTLENEIKILLVCNLLEGLFNVGDLSELELAHLLNTSVVLPTPVFPLPLVTTSSAIAKEKSTVIPYAIGDLHMTQHKLIGYQPGEIAHIENVLPGEIKERSNSSSNEITQASSYTDTTSFSNDQTIEGTLEALNKEIDNALTGTDKKEDDYSNLKTTYGPPTTTDLNGTVTKTRTPNLTDKTTHIDFAKKVLNKAVAQMSSNIKQVFTKRQVNKTEEAVVHTLDNRNSDKSIRGIYTWVNKVYETRVINYGNRFLLEFLIDHPFPTIEANATLIEKGVIAPANRKEPIASFKDITRENYAILAADYGVLDVPLPPDEFKSSFLFFNEDNVLTAQMMTINEGYIPFKTEIAYSITTDMEVLVGSTVISLSSSNTQPPTSNTQENTPIENSTNEVTNKISQALDKTSYSTQMIPVVVNQMVSYSTAPLNPGFYISVVINNEPSGSLMDTWKVKVYDAIMNAYKFNIEKSKDQITELENKNRSKRKQWIKQSVKVSCKEILYEIYLDKNVDPKTGIAVETSSIDNDSQPAYDQFFEEAIEWNESVYEFYDPNHPFTINEINLSIEQILSDQLFFERFNEKQLRVMIPVDPNFNYKILYYLSTGMISYIQDTITPIVTQDQSIVVAIKKVTANNHTPSIYGSPWQIHVPTNMQWLQENNQLPFSTK